MVSRISAINSTLDLAPHTQNSEKWGSSLASATQNVYNPGGDCSWVAGRSQNFGSFTLCLGLSGITKLVMTAATAASRCSQQKTYHSQKTCTPPKINGWNLKMMVCKMILLFQGCILRFHVNLPGCTNKYIRVVHVELSWGISETTRTSPPKKIVWLVGGSITELNNICPICVISPQMFKVNWLVVSTQLNNIRQIGWFPQVGVNITNIWNHHLVNINKNICETNAETAFCGANPSFYVIGSPALIHRCRHPPQ